MTADERVATYLLEDQTADLTGAIREAVQNDIDSLTQHHPSLSDTLKRLRTHLAIE